jgi:uncharacterized protein YcbK (DUF882 family)
MRIRSNVQLLLGALCVVALPAPILLATTGKGEVFLRNLVPPAPLFIAPSTPPAPPASSSVVEPSMSDGHVQIQPLPSREIAVRVENVNSGETATFQISDGGRTRLEQAIAIEHFFRCRRTGRHKPLSDSVLGLLADVAKRWPGRIIEIVSGYRAPPFGTRHSRHFAGNAIDLRVKGVRTARVRDFVWREHREVGVGHYAEQDFVHIDSRPGLADTAWSAPREDSPPQYDPRWAKRARRSLRTPALPGALALLTSAGAR